MSKCAASLYVFGVYCLVLGATLVLIPNPFIALFGFPATSEVWLRVVGMLLIFLGGYDALAAHREWVDFFRLSVWFRGSVILFFAAFVLAGLAPPVLLVFGAIDLAAATWTALTLPPRGGARTTHRRSRP